MPLRLGRRLQARSGGHAARAGPRRRGAPRGKGGAGRHCIHDHRGLPRVHEGVSGRRDAEEPVGGQEVRRGNHVGRCGGDQPRQKDQRAVLRGKAARRPGEEAGRVGPGDRPGLLYRRGEPVRKGRRLRGGGARVRPDSGRGGRQRGARRVVRRRNPRVDQEGGAVRGRDQGRHKKGRGRTHPRNAGPLPRRRRQVQGRLRGGPAVGMRGGRRPGPPPGRRQAARAKGRPGPQGGEGREAGGGQGAARRRRGRPHASAKGGRHGGVRRRRRGRKNARGARRGHPGDVRNVRRAPRSRGRARAGREGGRGGH